LLPIKESLLICIVTLLAPCSGAVSFSRSESQSTPPSDRADAQKWREDLRCLAQMVPLIHKNAFHRASRQEFEDAVRKLEERMPSLARHQIIVELQRIVAMIGDGHTRIDLESDPAIGFHRYAVQFYFFKDGLFVRAASSDYAEAVGGRVLRLGHVSGEEAYQKVRSIVSHDSDMWVRNRVPRLLSIPEVLHALDISDRLDEAQLVVLRDGKRLTLDLKPSSGQPGDLSIDMRNPANRPTPLWQKDPHNYFWFDYLEDSRTMYVQYNGVANKRDESIASFFDRVLAFTGSHAVDRLVIDLRLNGGGNNLLNWPLIYNIIRSDKINQRGRLFAIIGRETFSAAQNCVNALENHTKVIFVGEPTGSSPNAYGDAARIGLPNSGIGAFASTIFWQDVDPRDTREWTPPEIAAELTSTDYREGRDPALTAALNYKPRKPLADDMMDALEHANMRLAMDRYREYRSDPTHVYVNTERAISGLGYRLMQAKRFDQAVEILSLNVRDYPNSAIGYYYLASAYVSAGNKALAIKNCEKSLELDPRNMSAVEMLRRLKRD
jgi:tetratricopeptide (TPR) repeat protein